MIEVDLIDDLIEVVQTVQIHAAPKTEKKKKKKKSKEKRGERECTQAINDAHMHLYISLPRSLWYSPAAPVQP